MPASPTKPSSRLASPARQASALSLNALSINSPARGQVNSLRDTIHKSGAARKQLVSTHSREPSSVAGGRRSPKKSGSGGLSGDGGLGREVVGGRADWEGTGAGALRGAEGVRRSPTKKGKQNSDRFIPSRSSSTSGGGSDHTGPILLPSRGDDDVTGPIDPPDLLHAADLSHSLGIDPSKRILSFSSAPPPPQSEHSALLASYARMPHKGSAASSSSAAAAAARRRIATAPERVLDAPGLMDDYYLNLLDWSASNLVAIGLGESVYVWNAESGEVNLLCSVGPEDGAPETEGGDEYVCSVKFTEDGSFLAVGLSSGPIRVYDVVSGALIRTMSGHLSRVPSLSWSGAILSSGCRTGEIVNSDVRIATHQVAEMRGHRGEVCGLEWRPEIAGGLSGGGQGLLASGGNDNVVNVWDGRMTATPRMQKTNHTAAVKALAWCPWSPSLLATGGGSSDRTIHFWNTTTSARLNSLLTPSQVTSLRWNPHSKEILSSHGIPDHHLSLWSYPGLTKVADIPQAHEARILHSAISPDGTTVATASADENLKFWKVFEVAKRGTKVGAGGAAYGQKEVDEAGGKTRVQVR